MRWAWPLWAMLLGVAWAQPSQVDPWQAYREHRWVAAEQALASIHSWRAQMAAGWSACQLKACERSLRYFRQAAWFARTAQQRAEALLNLGNAFYKLGRYAEAVDSFDNALIYQPNNRAVRNNLAVAKSARQRWLVQQRLKSEQGKRQQAVEDDFAFAGGQKPAGKGERDVWDNRIDSVRDRGPDLVSGQKALADERALPPTVQLQQAARLDPLTRAQLVERFTQQLSQLQDKQWTLQRRLFEREEGFEAAQTQPHNIKGAAPW